jgi:hypothetical protein
MIRNIVYYPGGYTGAINENHNQDHRESEPWYVTVTRHYMAAGLVADNTLIHVPATYSGPISSLRGTHYLPASTSSPAYFSLYFYPDGRTVAIDVTGAQVDLEPWYMTALADKIARQAVGPDTMIHVPNVFAGTVATLLQKT